MSPTVRARLREVGLFGVLSLTLGLAPFFPEPHVWGKLRWVLGGGEGMSAMDYGDLLLHGAPWVGLMVSLVRLGMARRGPAGGRGAE